METCKIKWIDDQGKPTPDENPAIGRVMLPDAVHQINGRGVKIDASPWFPICAEHAKRLSEPDMALWKFEPYSCPYALSFGAEAESLQSGVE